MKQKKYVALSYFFLFTFLLGWMHWPFLSVHRYLTSYHSPALDALMRTATHVGDGLFFCSVILFVLIWISKKEALQLSLIFLLSSGMAQFLKRVIFPNALRPMAYFKGDPQFHIIKNLDYHLTHSFPSGHSTSVFALASFICLAYSKRISYDLLLLIAACFFAFTRIYLSQHFLHDVVAGSLIGISSTLLIWKWTHLQWQALDQPWLQKNR
ncbi:MAG: hypothetical protein RLZZ301_822 [Bacteroidota bacterium]|jgi:membrane-associated phospholipid phosphatase